MSWAESKEAGPEAGQGRGKLVSYDWLTKSSPGLPVSIGLKVSRHLVYSPPPNQVTRNKQLHILTMFVSVSLDTGFLASAVKHL